MEITKHERGPAPDYTWVDSREKAWRLVEEGALVGMWMLPGMFGGVEDDRNIVFVPAEVADRKDRIDEQIILPLVQAGKPVEYSVRPEYRGGCLVPTSLEISAFAPEPHIYFLDVWGGSPADRA